MLARRTILTVLLCAAAAARSRSAEPVKWETFPTYRFIDIKPNGAAKTGFTQVPAVSSGVQFTNHLSDRLVAINRVTENGSGVALGDVDGDGWCDIYFCRLEGPNVLYRNLGNWRFEDITAQAGVACDNQLSTAAVFVDLDGDGDLDLLVNSIGGGTRAFLNDGHGKFEETPGGRLVKRFGSTSMALADIDSDGDLDLYVANYRTLTTKDEFPRPNVQAKMENGRIVVTPPGRFTAIPTRNGNAQLFEIGERDFLYLNDGHAGFSPISWTTGNFLDETGLKLDNAPLDWGLSVMLRDLNDDGLIDIVVCNDFFNSPDRIWFQQAGSRFQLASRRAVRKASLASMAVDVADINRDGFDDIFFAEMLGRNFSFRQNHRDNVMKANLNSELSQRDPLFRFETPRNTLFLNRGDGTYAEIAELAGLDASDWSWGAVFLDVDLDGFEDLLIPTGHNHDVQNSDLLRQLGQSTSPDSIEQRTKDLALFPRLNTEIVAFHNSGQLRFTEKQREWGLGIFGVANGFACADLDNDGDLDLVANRLNGEALLLRNDTTAPRIAVRIKGQGGNTRAIGAKISVSGGPAPQSQTMISGGRYLSCDDTIRTFACGTNTALSAEVRWPNATRSLFTNLQPNRIYEFSQTVQAVAVEPSKNAQPFFEDVSDKLKHRHQDPPFDDFAREPLLPYSLATQGPGLAWYDFDSDGLVDLIIGAGRGGSTAFFKNTGEGFTPVRGFGAQLALDDQMGLLAARSASNALLFVATANYESGAANSPSVDIVSLMRSNRVASLPGQASSAGALALADVDHDGDLDLFVAGRVLPARYPAAATSRLFLNDSGSFSIAAASAVFEKVGLVSSALFTDLNNDGWADLVLATECGPIRVFLNEHGHLSEAKLGLEKLAGWWTGLARGDFDGDGLTDLVVGNWGRNTKYQRFVQDHPLRIYHSDFDTNGTYDLFEAIFNSRLNKYVPLAGPEAIVEHFPAAAARFPTFAAYAKAGIEDVLEQSIDRASLIELNTLDSVCLLNRGTHFEVRPLPIEAQFAPVFGLVVGDFNGDGIEDIVAGQNLFDTPWETGRLDSGRPLLLAGAGNGTFRTTSAGESGLSADGQQRAVATADFNNDGRLDLAITQNNDETKLFVNKHAPEGLRLVFEGPMGNPDAIGTRFRIQDGAHLSPVREVQCGSGWLSQNSRVQILKKPNAGAHLLLTWPDGKSADFTLPSGAREIQVEAGGIKMLR